jgi:hypothetical protein
VGVALVESTGDVEELGDIVAEGESPLPACKAPLNPVRVLDWDAPHAQIVVEMVEVDTRESSLDVHAQHGGDLAAPPCILDHLHYFMERIGGGPPRPGTELIRREYAGELSLSDLL